jgi:hypothetical protein
LLAQPDCTNGSSRADELRQRMLASGREFQLVPSVSRHSGGGSVLALSEGQAT